MINERILAGLRAFQPEDLRRVLNFVGTCCTITDFCGCFHPGDISHFLSNRLRGQNLSQHLFFTQDTNGQVNALIMIHPARFSSFDLMVHPNQRGGEFESQLIAWAEKAVLALLRAESPTAGSEPLSLSTEVMTCDLARVSALERRGYQPDAQHSMMVTIRSLTEFIPEPFLPEGFTIRPAAGEHEASLLADVHSGAFNSNWTPEEYLKVMRSPGFDIEREWVVVAPDGRFAAFTIIWFDPISRSGLFEPVGCHPDFQRLGLARALMYDAMHEMRAQGMTTAVVLHHTDNPASTGLYASVGFTPKYAITTYKKTFQA